VAFIALVDGKKNSVLHNTRSLLNETVGICEVERLTFTIETVMHTIKLSILTSKVGS
jgi:hypothetical protein